MANFTLSESLITYVPSAFEVNVYILHAFRVKHFMWIYHNSCGLLMASYHTVSNSVQGYFEICGGANDNEAGFYLSSSLSPPLLCTHLAPITEVCNSPDQAAHGWMHSKQVILGLDCISTYLGRM